MNTHLTFSMIFILALCTISRAQTIERSKTLNEIVALSGVRLPAYESIDKGSNPVLTFAIVGIPKTVKATEFKVINASNPADSITGNEKLKVVKTGTSYDLKFDVSAMFLEGGTLTTAIVEQKGKELTRFDLVEKKGSDPTICKDQTTFQLQAGKDVIPIMKALRLKEDRGVFASPDGVIHLFIDQYGKFYGHGLPTTATTKHRYQIHLITSTCHAKDFAFQFSYEGTFEEQFNIDSYQAETKSVPTPVNDKLVIVVLDYPEIGPFTDALSLKLIREDKTLSSTKTILDAKIKIAKLYHVSISTGLLATTLRNPSNIQKMAIPGGKLGDSTLVADDPAGRGLLSIMAVYYPQGRSFLLPPSGGVFDLNRLGIVVGAQLNDKLQENFLGGLSFDFARGGSVAFGGHFGRRNYVAGYDRFKFGEDLITGDLVVKKEWQLGFFFGVVIDTRVALKLFNLGDPK